MSDKEKSEDFFELPVLSTLSFSYSSNDSPTGISLIDSNDEGKDNADDSLIEEEPDVPLPSSLPRYRPSKLTTIDDIVGDVIGPTDLIEAAACPCCQQELDESNTQTLNEPKALMFPADVNRCRSILPTDTEEDEEEEELRDEQEEVLPGDLGAGVKYYQKNILIEGWLHKKGTGQDWLGSRAWKARWARLVTARVDGYDCDVPLLQMYWHPSSLTPSTVFLLESTVVLAVDLEDKDRWNSYRFEIRHAASRENATVPVTRTFAAPKKDRDAWVFAMSEALLAYEKLKSQKKAVPKSLRTPIGYDAPKSPGSYDEMWTGDRFVTLEVRRPMSPPSSPPPPVNPRRLHLRSPPTSPPLPKPARRAPPKATRVTPSP